MALTWHELVRVVMEVDEGGCDRLMEDELSGPRRLRHLLRIHSRKNKLRADRERCELIVESSDE